MIEQGIIEIAPLAYMRGRTLNDAFVILDEAQNTTPEQMKMFLTRLGFRSRFVVTGDASQRDLAGPSGLTTSARALEGTDDIAFVDLGRADIVRHPLVARIVEAYTSAPSGTTMRGERPMSAEIELFCEEGASLAIDEAELARVFDLVLAEEGVERTCCVSVSVLGESSMQALNAEWRGVEAPTDVISLECERPDDPTWARTSPASSGTSQWHPRCSPRSPPAMAPRPRTTRLLGNPLAAAPAGLRPRRGGRRRRHGGARGRASGPCCGHDLGHVATTRHADDTPLPKAGERP